MSKLFNILQPTMTETVEAYSITLGGNWVKILKTNHVQNVIYNSIRIQIA